MARAGQFRDRVTVERKTDAGTLDAYGNPAGVTWAAEASFWADLRETTGKERLAAGRLEGAATATMRLRASARSWAITAADRVLARGETWKIIGGPIDPTGLGQLVELTLERGGAVQ